MESKPISIKIYFNIIICTIPEIYTRMYTVSYIFKPIIMVLQMTLQKYGWFYLWGLQNFVNNIDKKKNKKQPDLVRPSTHAQAGHNHRDCIIWEGKWNSRVTWRVGSYTFRIQMGALYFEFDYICFQLIDYLNLTFLMYLNNTQ